MNFKGHSIGGVVSATIVTITTITLTSSIIDGLLYGFIAYMFALYPDVDIKSTSLRIWLFVAISFALYLFYLDDIYRGAITVGLILLPMFFKHRGMAHTLKFGLLAAGACYYVITEYYSINNIYFISSAMIGFITHLILDKHIKL